MAMTVAVTFTLMVFDSFVCKFAMCAPESSLSRSNLRFNPLTTATHPAGRVRPCLVATEIIERLYRCCQYGGHSGPCPR